MAVEKSYAPLGLFLVVGLVVVLATALFFIQRLRRREVITMVTYTRENVSGLEVSSPVRYRGVSLGRITDVRVDPRSNSIEVDFEVFLHRLVTVGANVERVQSAASGGGIFENLRAQIVRNPVTGEAYLLLDRPETPRHRCRSDSRRIGPMCRRCPRCFRRWRIGCRRFWSAPQ